jgi:nicotinate-nucleotide pyrophosphorylase (carboxylating)
VLVTDAQVEGWLTEDLGHHDVTNEVPGTTTGRLVARESGIVAGLDAATAVFEYLDVSVDSPVAAGDRVREDDVVLEVAGPTEAILRAERTAVNLAGHASGVATRTRRAVDAAREVSAAVRIAGTRKTTPGLRGLEKRAIAAGGGDTHRLDASHMVMVKDNHVAAMGLENAVRHLRAKASFATRVEVEVEAVKGATTAVDAGADVVLLDNMDPAATSRGVDLVMEAASDLEREVLVEASGGIAVDSVPEYAATGVDVISLGCLTHSAPALDLSFRVG